MTPAFPRSASPRAHLVGRNRKGLLGGTALRGITGFALLALSGSIVTSVQAQGLPTGGSVSAGAATIVSAPTTVTVTQTTRSAALNWDSFNIAAGNTVAFVQPNSSAVALNRVVGADPTAILGNLTANGQVFLINPNGVLFGQSAQVDVGGLVASTLGLSDADFMAGRYGFAGSSGAAVLNQGTITAADGGYVALLGANVGNQGAIVARLGTVALAAGQAVTLDLAGDGLLNVAVDTGAVNALVRNGGLIRADGGQVVLTAQSAGQLLRTAVNNTGVIEARTIENRSGRIVLLGDMASGTVDVSGTLDASASGGGNGGFIETSAATVNVADGVSITTAAPLGTTGTWLIDPADFIVAANGGNISGSTLSAQLVTNSVTISTLPQPGDNTVGNGDIFVNDAVAWSASGTPTTLTMNAARDVNINAPITATNGNVVACCGRDVNVNAAMTTTNGSILLNAGRDVLVFHAITTTDGNIALCAGHDVHIDAAVTLTRGTTIPARSLGLPVGLTLIAGASGQGPGVAGGTIIFAPLAPPTTVTVAPVSIAYNPVSYAAPDDFSIHFVLTEGAALTQRMLLFPDGDKVFDGTSGTVLNGFNTSAVSGTPTGVTLVAGPGATATFDDPAVGAGVGISYSGYTLGGVNADRYTLASACCTAGQRTTGTITPVAVVVPPVVVPPVDVPVVVPPVVVPPVDVPVVVPPVVVPPIDVPVVVPPVVVPPVDIPVVVPPVVVPPVGVPVVVLPVVVPVDIPTVVPPVVVTPVAVQPSPTVVPPVPDFLPRATPAVVGPVGLTVVGRGLRVPVSQVSWNMPTPAAETATDDTLSAFLPAPEVPVVPPRPPKQGRN